MNNRIICAPKIDKYAYNSFGWRELNLALFIFAGIFKTAFNFPIDLTILFATLLLISCFIEIYHSRTISKYIGFMLFLWILMSYSIFNSDSSYGLDKSIRFYSLTLTAGLAPIILIKNKIDLMRLFNALLFISLIILLNSIGKISEIGQFDRLTAFNSNTIALGRAIGLGLIIILNKWILDRFSRFWGLLLITAMIFTLISSGSRGPILALIISIASILMLNAGTLKTIYKSIFLSCIIIGGIIITLPFVPSQSSMRIQSLFEGNIDTSSAVRAEAIKYSLPELLENPLGIGAGQFMNRVILSPSDEPVTYPHNIFIEIGLEGGWVPLTYFIMLILLAIYKSLKYIKIDYLPGSLLLSTFIFSLINSSISGDVNDNKILWLTMGLCLAGQPLNKSI